MPCNKHKETLYVNISYDNQADVVQNTYIMEEFNFFIFTMFLFIQMILGYENIIFR